MDQGEQWAESPGWVRRIPARLTNSVAERIPTRRLSGRLRLAHQCTPVAVPRVADTFLLNLSFLRSGAIPIIPVLEDHTWTPVVESTPAVGQWVPRVAATFLLLACLILMFVLPRTGLLYQAQCKGGHHQACPLVSMGKARWAVQSNTFKDCPCHPYRTWTQPPDPVRHPQSRHRHRCRLRSRPVVGLPERGHLLVVGHLAV